MSKRKYFSYVLATEDANEKTFDNYRDAFAAFNRAHVSATLYGETEFADIEVITSK